MSLTTSKTLSGETSNPMARTPSANGSAVGVAGSSAAASSSSSSSAALRTANGSKSAVAKRRSFKRKSQQLAQESQELNITQYILDHQISLSAIPLSILLTLHFASPVDSELHNLTKKFYSVTYYNPVTGMYGKGKDDVYLVLFWVVILVILRVVVMDYIASPWARMQGMGKKGAIRFAEQAWSAVYYFFSFAIGMQLMVGSKYWFDLSHLWTDWPLRELDGAFKWYYLVQAACWLQQILVLHIEQRRKDHYQMFAHHIITCILIYCSYVYHMTRIGHVILCLFDFGDILLPAAKMLKYLKFQKSCDGMFGLFLLSWIVCRHLFFVNVIFSAHVDSSKHIPFGCFDQDITSHVPLNETSLTSSDMFLRPQQTVCFNQSIKFGFVGLLWALQSLTCVWFFMIMRVAIKVITGRGAEDVRSDDEEEAEVEPVEADVSHLDVKLANGAEVYAESSSSAHNGSLKRRRVDGNGTPLRDVFIGGGKHSSQSQFSAAQKLAESKIGCGGDDR